MSKYRCPPLIMSTKGKYTINHANMFVQTLFVHNSDLFTQTHTYIDTHTGQQLLEWRGVTVRWKLQLIKLEAQSQPEILSSLFHQSNLLSFCFVDQQPPHFYYEDFRFFIKNLKHKWINQLSFINTIIQRQGTFI